MFLRVYGAPRISGFSDRMVVGEARERGGGGGRVVRWRRRRRRRRRRSEEIP